MANNLKPIIVGAPEQVNRSVRVTFLEATDKDITIMVKIGAVDTNKPKGESMIPDQGIITHTKRSIVNTYCAPFGDGNLFFDTFRQRKTTLNYHFEAATEVPLFSFTVSEKDCSI